LHRLNTTARALYPDDCVPHRVYGKGTKTVGNNLKRPWQENRHPSMRFGLKKWEYEGKEDEL